MRARSAVYLIPVFQMYARVGLFSSRLGLPLACITICIPVAPLFRPDWADAPIRSAAITPLPSSIVGQRTLGFIDTSGSQTFSSRGGNIFQVKEHECRNPLPILGVKEM
jgi:hypothetical protein